jgi:uncharacterized protein (DUF1919 family)
MLMSVSSNSRNISKVIKSNKNQTRIRLNRFLDLSAILKGKLVAIHWTLRSKIFARYYRSKLRNKEFSIICNNCVAGLIYQKFGLPYLTPTVGLFFYSEDYIKFIGNFEHYIQQPLGFTTFSKHHESSLLLKRRNYPIGLLGNDVEIHFMHYKTPEEALEKWNRRKKRINFNALFFIYSDRDNFHEEFLQTYGKLPFKHKIFLSSKPRGNKDLVVFVKDYEKETQVGESEHNGKYLKYIDIVKWLNGEPDYIIK